MKQNKLILNWLVNILKRNSFFLLYLLLLSSCDEGTRTTNQKTSYSNWYTASFENDSIPGIGLTKAYTLLKKSTDPVIVAVIDTPVDLNHPVFSNRLYINHDEIPGNNLDDDNNGYVDDINGWNFVGYDKNKSVYFTSYEIVRLIRHLENQDELDSLQLKKLIEAHQLQRETAQKRLTKSNNDLKAFYNAKKVFPHAIRSNGTIDTVASKEINPKDEEETKLKKFLTRYGRIGLYEKQLIQFKIGGEGEISKSLNLQYDDRSIAKGHAIINDIENMSQHATQVGGLIAEATNGVNFNRPDIIDIKLMFLSVSGVGDYHNNDLAAAIRYAVDNGASVINFSDSKPYSVGEEKVTQAIKYAAKNNVLMVTSAGNNNLNTDDNKWYPLDYRDDFNEFLDNLLVVGASTNKIDKLKGSFSNYGQQTVDIFAPGSKITIPNGEVDVPYIRLGGTSLASALTSASAAIIISQYPDLKAGEIKELLLQSSTNIEEDTFKSYSKSGKVLDVYKVLEKLKNRHTKH
ncbi:S8 family serine peptidase [Spongiivirga citrea]|uniref:S8 family serine peptidase n=1 Tax=Spongiivirga citrea TaxID=1481457 RepID=A0A6M0CQQ9_9FLAO|nr:S8 family serine peptidase [Spongiivirga citrea]NER18394.1 S8 family serine peptidase [Spongiivirga citrea]